MKRILELGVWLSVAVGIVALVWLLWSLDMPLAAKMLATALVSASLLGALRESVDG